MAVGVLFTAAAAGSFSRARSPGESELCPHYGGVEGRGCSTPLTSCVLRSGAPLWSRPFDMYLSRHGHNHVADGIFRRSKGEVVGGIDCCAATNGVAETRVAAAQAEAHATASLADALSQPKAGGGGVVWRASAHQLPIWPGATPSRSGHGVGNLPQVDACVQARGQFVGSVGSVTTHPPPGFAAARRPTKAGRCGRAVSPQRSATFRTPCWLLQARACAPRRNVLLAVRLERGGAAGAFADVCHALVVRVDPRDGVARPRGPLDDSGKPACQKQNTISSCLPPATTYRYVKRRTIMAKRGVTTDWHMV